MKEGYLRLICLCLAVAFSVPTSCRILKLHEGAFQVTFSKRRLTMIKHLLRVDTEVTYRGMKKEAQRSLIFAMNATHFDHLARFSYKEQSKNFLNVKRSSFRIISLEDAPYDTERYAIYEVQLKAPVEEGQEITVLFSQIFTRRHECSPSEQSWKRMPSYMLEDSINYVSPYAVKSQETTFKSEDCRLLSHQSDKLPLMNKDTTELTFITSSETKPFERSFFSVRFICTSPYITTSLHRSVYVSEYSEVEFVEHHVIRNHANNLTGEFSRLDFEYFKSAQTPYIIQELNFELPIGSFGFYYRDDVGNISTSSLSFIANQVLLSVKPRFPIMGGWNTEFTIKYKVPVEYILKVKDSSVDSNRFFEINLLGALKDHVSFDDFTLDVILPEQSTLLNSRLPSNVDLQSSEHHSFYYLDTIGRPTIRIQGNNLIKSQDATLKFSYSHNTLLLLLKPYYASLGFFIILFSVAIFSRYRVQISKTASRKDKLDRVVKWFEHFDTLCQSKLKTLQNYWDTIDELKMGLIPLKKFDSSVQGLDKTLETLKRDLDASYQFLVEIIPECKHDLTKKVTLLDNKQKVTLEHSQLAQDLKNGIISEKTFLSRWQSFQKEDNENNKNIRKLLS